MRGTVHPVRRASLTPSARAVLLADLEIPLVSLEDLYGALETAQLSAIAEGQLQEVRRASTDVVEPAGHSLRPPN